MRSFTDETIPGGAVVLVLAPHPDDFDAIGVTLRYLHERGHALHVTVVSGSASGVLDEFCGADPDAKRIAREREQRDSTRFFGLPDDNLVFLRLPEDHHGAPVADAHFEDLIRRHIKAISPHLVFLPHGNDTNVGHQRVCAAFRRIAVSAGLPMRAYYIRDPKTTGMRTDVYMGFDDTIAAWKRRLLLHHASQDQRNLKLRHHGFDDRILNVNRDIALALGLNAPYAEAFEVEAFGG